MVSIAQDANPEHRSYMEDECVVADNFYVRRSSDRTDETQWEACPGEGGTWAFFGVYDGHGGRGAVDACKDGLHEAIADQLAGLPRIDYQSVHGALASAFQQVDTGLHHAGGGWKCGCTATAALVHRIGGELTLYVANVGDSRALMIGDGDAKRVSIDHRACDPAEARRLERSGAVVRNGRVAGALGVSRSIGDHYLKPGVSCMPDICTDYIDGARILVIASDGLWERVDDDEVQEIIEDLVERTVAANADPKAVSSALRASTARVLVERAKERGSKDNITVLAAFF